MRATECKYFLSLRKVQDDTRCYCALLSVPLVPLTLFLLPIYNSSILQRKPFGLGRLADLIDKQTDLVKVMFAKYHTALRLYDHEILIKAWITVHKHRIMELLWLEKTSKTLKSNPYQLNQSIKCYVQSFLENFQGCWVHHLPGLPIAMLGNPDAKMSLRNPLNQCVLKDIQSQKWSGLIMAWLVRLTFPWRK